MTDKEILHQKRKSVASGSHVEYYSEIEILKAMNEYALHIAEKAKEAEINDAHSDTVKDALNFYGGRVVDRMKTLMDQE